MALRINDGGGATDSPSMTQILGKYCLSIFLFDEGGSPLIAEPTVTILLSHFTPSAVPKQLFS